MYKNGQIEDKGVTLLTHQGYGIPSIGDSPKQEYFRGKTQEEKSIYSNVLSSYVYISDARDSFYSFINYYISEYSLSYCLHLIKQWFVLQIHMISKLEILPGFVLQLPNFSLTVWLLGIHFFPSLYICLTFMSLFNSNKGWRNYYSYFWDPSESLHCLKFNKYFADCSLEWQLGTQITMATEHTLKECPYASIHQVPWNAACMP